MTTPGFVQRFVNQLIQQLPTHGDSPKFRAMAPGWLAFQQAPLFGIGPGNLRLLCGDIVAGSPLYDCHPPPHNYYIQMFGEAGIIGFLTGVLFLGSIIWACARPALRYRSNVVVATMWIVPFVFFWPIVSTADCFAQWKDTSCGVQWLWRWLARRSAARTSQAPRPDHPSVRIRFIARFQPVTRPFRLPTSMAGVKPASRCQRAARSSSVIDV